LSKKCPYCGKVFKRLSAHKCPMAPSEDKKEKVQEEKIKEKVVEKSKPKEKISPKASIKSKVSQSLKDLIGKAQAETNIGLVGHVDHGIN